MTDELIGKGANAISDLLTMLGVDPDERQEHGGPTTAETLAAAVIRAVNAVDVEKIRHWCDSSGEGMRTSIKTAPRSASAEVFGYNAGLMAAVHQVRALLPAEDTADPSP
jgi:hypothetical protein